MNYFNNMHTKDIVIPKNDIDDKLDDLNNNLLALIEKLDQIIKEG